MSIKTFDSALDFTPEASHRAGTWSSIKGVFDAIWEGIELAAEYKELTNRGVAHEAAARRVFDKLSTH